MFNQQGCRLQILDAAESSFNNHIASELVHCNTSGSSRKKAKKKQSDSSFSNDCLWIARQKFFLLYLTG